MPYQRTIQTVRQALNDIFTDMDRWFEQPNELREYQPRLGWSILLSRPALSRPEPIPHV